MTRLEEVVTRQHRQILVLLDAIAAERRKGFRAALASALADAWRAHSACEERLLYPPKSIEIEEHAMIAFMLERVAKPAPGDTTYARIRVLRELLVRHHDLEERVRLPAAVRRLTPPDEQRVARAIETAFKPYASSTTRAAHGGASRRRDGARRKASRAPSPRTPGR